MLTFVPAEWLLGRMPPSPSVDAIMLTAAHMPGLACFDTGLQTTLVTWGTGPYCTAPSEWKDFVRNNCHPKHDPSPVYKGGVVGWIGYEAGATVEQMPSPTSPRTTHDVCLWRTNGGLTLDHTTGKWRAEGSAQFMEEANEIMVRAQDWTDQDRSTELHQSWTPESDPSQSDRFQKNVHSVLHAIREGEVYQVNLAWEQVNIPIENGLRSWLALRHQNPALRGCYLREGSTEVLSNSPELFLHIDGTTNMVNSIPIKGTAPVSGGDAAKSALKTSPKEKAELTMIVDLVRNDLGRIATPGTVVAGERTLRQCGDLWHAEQQVSAKLKPNTDMVDVVAATFPPGSVTGAPKVRAMEVINALEVRPRGVYTGAIGWFADGGSAHLNVAIRTATVQSGIGRFHVGAGIVADSQPELEWHETLAKARALTTCLELP